MAVRLRHAAALVSVLLAAPASAHQPVMDMSPRWSDGFGLRVRQEYRVSDDVLRGSSNANSGLDRTRRVRKTWFEGCTHSIANAA